MACRGPSQPLARNASHGARRLRINSSSQPCGCEEICASASQGGNAATCLKGHCWPDSAQSSAASVIARSFSLNLEMKSKLGSDFASLATAHLHFAEWERIRHRARTYALIFFPDSHPFRQAVDTVCNDLESVRYEAEVSLHRIVRAHGAFRCTINGFFFENPEDDLFKSDAQRYHDCPEYIFGKGIKREKVMPLAGIGSIHALETRGRSFITAAEQLAEATTPRGKRRLEQTAKIFESDCKRVDRQLKRIRVDPKQKAHAVLCLLRTGLPKESANIVLSFLV